MAKQPKEHTIRSWHRGRPHDWTGTLEYLENEVFGYKLECGNAWNPKIPRFPKSAKGLVTALNKSADETQGSCFERDSYELIG